MPQNFSAVWYRGYSCQRTVDSPMRHQSIAGSVKGCKAVMTVEEHNVNGGLGSLVAEVLAEAGTGIKLKRAGIMDGEYAAAADRGWLRQHHGFDAAGIAAQAREML